MEKLTEEDDKNLKSLTICLYGLLIFLGTYFTIMFANIEKKAESIQSPKYDVISTNVNIHTTNDIIQNKYVKGDLILIRCDHTYNILYIDNNHRTKCITIPSEVLFNIPTNSMTIIHRDF
jgi:hypothetical protein